MWACIPPRCPGRPLSRASVQTRHTVHSARAGRCWTHRPPPSVPVPKKGWSWHADSSISPAIDTAMTARERVLAAYGGMCAWCHSPTRLEIDHIHNDGAAHRHAIMMKLEYWLCREYTATGSWPTGVQLLCQHCHDRKSGRIPHMPARHGAQQINISLPDSMAAQLALLASAPEYGSKSRVLEAALRLLIEGSATESALAGVHQRISELSDKTTEALQAVESALVRVTNG